MFPTTHPPRSFFLSVKSKYYKDRKRSQVYTGCEQKGDKTKPYRKQTQKPYLLPNHVRKSKTEFVLSTLYRLAQVHKLETKLALILWAEVTSFSNTNLFLARQRVQNRHIGAAIKFFFIFYLRRLLAKLKGCEGPNAGKPS